ncbi:MAG: hypothetical protein IPN53_22570 [Comamonadaceae bacterium]|nr:hypothetical protein [Comamonadaceae bacterium]
MLDVRFAQHLPAIHAMQCVIDGQIVLVMLIHGAVTVATTGQWRFAQL